MQQLEALEAHVAAYSSALIAYSGGVDSSLVAVAVRRALGPERALAALGVSPSLSVSARHQALRLAQRFDVPLVELETGELDDPRYRANPTNRCYFCKTALWSTLVPLARERGLAAVVDGTNVDDLAPSEHRPGARAGGEWGVRSPLAELGLTKAMVRATARALGLPNWDAPAAPCLSSRVRFGLDVTRERLRQVERAETILRERGVRGDLRVRHLGRRARVEVTPDALAGVRAVWSDLEPRLRALGFDAVELDPRGYRRGALVLEG